MQPVQKIIRSVCPFANTAILPVLDNVQCSFHAHKVPKDQKVTLSIPVTIQGDKSQRSQPQADLLQDIGGGDRIREHCTRFYANVFKDKELDQFMFMDDGAEAHGKRLADWIIEKMGGEGYPWTDSGRLGQRQPTHYKAWNNPKRSQKDRGNHFNLTDVVRWMCVFFWSARECGLDKHVPYFKWLVGFISHFSRVYDSEAPQYAKQASEWSLDPINIKNYKEGLPNKSIQFGKQN